MPKAAKNKLNPNYPLSPANREITLADYSPHPRNYNKHPQQQIERIAGSLQMFGQVRSVVVWRNYFLTGHGGKVKTKFLQLQAINERDLRDSAWCFIEIDSIQALVPGFESKGTYVLSSSGVQTHVAESPRDIMSMLEKL